MNNVNIDLKRLEECRVKQGLSKQKAAKAIGVSQPAYVRYESGERTPSIQVVKEIAKAFNTSTAYLLGKSDDSTPDCYVIESQKDPELFAIIDMYYKNSVADSKRFIEYMKKFR